MNPQVVGILGLVVMLLLVGIGMPIGFVMLGIGLVGYWLMEGSRAALGIFGGIFWNTLNNYNFTVIPLFVLMGNLAYHAGFGEDIFYTIRQWIGRLRGSLAMATCLGCAAFGTISGDAISCTITMGKIAIPEMEKAGYDIKLAIGSVAAAAPLAAMVPPSVLICLYGMIVEQSIGKLLIAGFLPGFMTAFVFSMMIYLRAWRNPSIAPVTSGVSWKQKIVSLKRSWVVALSAMSILGGMYTGVFTPTEAGGMAALIILVAGIASRRLNLPRIWNALADTAKIMGMICMVLVGAFMFNAMVVLTGIAPIMVDFIGGTDFPPLVVLIGIMGMYLILGCFMNAIAMLFLTMPLVYPIVLQLGFNPIWFGILVVHMCEIGCITPPYGLTLFAVKAVLPEGTPSSLVVRSILPFLLTDLVVLAILIAFPQITLFLPNLMW